MSITSLTRNGVKDFFMQRVTAVILAVYVVVFLGFVCSKSPMTYHAWVAMFHNPCMQFCTLLATLALIAHAWVGIWTILGDYIHCAWVRGILMVIFMIAFLGYIVWMIQILWGFSV